jgi:hypothetical protein
MGINIDDIISIMNKVIDIDGYSDLIEQDDSGGGAPPSGDDGVKPPYPTVTKWESGVTRGPANQIGLVKWADIVKINRGKANTLL